MSTHAQESVIEIVTGICSGIEKNSEFCNYVSIQQVQQRRFTISFEQVQLDI